MVATMAGPTSKPIGLRAGEHSIQLRLREITQLFNSLDPSPFNERDLDHDAEEFILSWARELPRKKQLHLIVHLEKPLPQGLDALAVAASVRHYFAYRATIVRLDLKNLFKEARVSLAIGTAFLVACLLLSRLIGMRSPEPAWSIAQEGLTIVGWVAMWKPMELYLYEWWPVRARLLLLRRLARLKIELKVAKAAEPPSTPPPPAAKPDAAAF